VRRDLEAGLLIPAAGGLVWRDGAGGPRLAVIRRPKRGDWRLPKGKLKEGESFTEAAVREVAEETGCRVHLREFAGYTLYQAKGRLKLVLYWHMAARGAPRFEPSDEVELVEWLPPGQALARLDRAAERRVVRGALAAPH
jgi:8-oxo-dGTP diphosphatase